MIKVIFVSNKKPGSLMISWGTKRKGQKMKDCPSHVAFQFDDKLVDSTLNKGVSISNRESLKSSYRIVKEIDLGLNDEETKYYFDKVLKEVEGAEYDSSAIAYFTLMVIRKKLFGIPYPEKNKFNIKNKWFCSELYSIISGKPEGMTSPNDLMYLLSEKGYGG